jgi:hypothetical protein
MIAFDLAQVPRAAAFRSHTDVSSSSDRKAGKPMPDLFRNERQTENIVRDELRRLGYYRAANGVVVEEQRSQIEAVRKLMKAASKSGHGGIGSPGVHHQFPPFAGLPSHHRMQGRS